MLLCTTATFQITGVSLSSGVVLGDAPLPLIQNGVLGVALTWLPSTLNVRTYHLWYNCNILGTPDLAPLWKLLGEIVKVSALVDSYKLIASDREHSTQLFSHSESLQSISIHLTYFNL